MRRHVRALNEHRRANTTPLTNAEKQARLDAQLKADPARSDRAIGEVAGVDHKTVAKARKKMGVGKSPPPAERKSKSGKVGEGQKRAKPKLKATTQLAEADREEVQAIVSHSSMAGCSHACRGGA